MVSWQGLALVPIAPSPQPAEAPLLTPTVLPHGHAPPSSEPISARSKDEVCRPASQLGVAATDCKDEPVLQGWQNPGGAWCLTTGVPPGLPWPFTCPASPQLANELVLC